MGESERERQRRAELRAKRITIRMARYDDTAEPAERGADALSLVRRLTRAAWQISGRALPHYTREQIPITFVPYDRSRA